MSFIKSNYEYKCVVHDLLDLQREWISATINGKKRRFRSGQETTLTGKYIIMLQEIGAEITTQNTDDNGNIRTVQQGRFAPRFAVRILEDLTDSKRINAEAISATAVIIRKPENVELEVEPEAAAPQLPNDEEKGIESLEQKDPDELTLGEARALAIHMGIEVPSGVRKVDIIRAIKDHHEVAEE